MLLFDGLWTLQSIFNPLSYFWQKCAKFVFCQAKTGRFKQTKKILDFLLKSFEKKFKKIIQKHSAQILTRHYIYWSTFNCISAVSEFI